MVESSWPWDGTSTGDAATAPYSSSEYAQFVRTAIDDHGVAPNARFHIPVSAYNYSSLRVTGTATPVSVAEGYAYIAGYTYINTAAETLAVASPAANPRIDRVVLRISWAAQTIRLALLAGSEAATPSPPSLTQTIGTTYEVSLAQVYITTGGVITVRDERVGYQGLGPGVFYRDIRDRAFEEFFDNFNKGSTTDGAIGENGWYRTIAGTGALTLLLTPPSAIQISSGATNGGTLTLFHGGGSVYATELAQAPLLFEARIQIATAVDANGAIEMRLIDSAATSFVAYGMRGSISTSNLMIRDAAGGAVTSFTTGQAVDTTGYHTYGILIPVSTGPAVAYYDGVAIGQIAGNIPATTTDLRAEFKVDNGATSAARTMNIDWARLVRGA
jgi:hypothetical protein